MNKVKLKIKGKQIEARLGIGFIELAIKKDKPEDNDVSNLGIHRLIGRAIEFAAEENEEEPEMTLFDIYDWVDEVGLFSDEYKEVINKFEKAFVASMQNHLEKKEVKETKPAKKKATKSG